MIPATPRLLALSAHLRKIGIGKISGKLDF
jgi:hypothetical protein